MAATPGNSPWYAFNFLALTNSNLAHRSGGPIANSNRECEFILGPTQGFLVTEDHAHQYIIVEPTGASTATILTTTDRGTRITWTRVPRTPSNIAEFRQFWNLLQESAIASIALIHEELGIVVTESGFQRLRGLEASHVYPVFLDDVHEAKVERSDNPQYSDLYLVRTSDLELSQFDFFLRHLSEELVESAQLDRLAEWNDEGMAVVFRNEKCRFRGKDFLLFVVPVELSYSHTDLTSNWVRHTFANGELKSRGTFRATFSALNEVAQGFETVPFDALNRFLEYRVEYEGQTVSFFDVRFPLTVLHLVGVIAIVIVQAYVVVHLAELFRRMRSARLGDVGAFSPWVFLYNQTSARCLSVCMLLFPTAAALVIQLSHDPGKGLHLKVFWAVGALGVVFSICLTLLSLIHAQRLRFLAVRHRRYTGGNR